MAESTLGVIHSISEEMDGTAPPCFTFGVIADIQYADKDDGYNYTQTSMRYYRNSLSLLRHAVEEWSRERIKPNCILQLGDLIDGFNVQYKTSETSLRKVLTEMAKLQIPFHHIWGNHEFYNFSRKYLTDSQLNTTPAADMADALPVTSTGSGLEEDPETFYAYHFSPFPKFRFLLIDSYDLSVIGRDPSSGKYEKSMKLLREKNPNEDLNSSTGHLPIHPDAANSTCLAWNYRDVLSVLQSHRCVVGYFAGHNHNGGYSVDTSGIHHVTINGVIETPPESQAFGTVHMYEERMVVKGRGLVSNRTLHYRNPENTPATHTD
ncbi:hypothetical protein FKM82_022991 [Ascaphus truei]